MQGAMSPLARTTGVAGLTTGLGIALMATVPGVSHSPPAVVTTDTAAYCRELSAKLTELVRIAPRPPEDEVLSMGVEGRHLCDEGQVRGGILRLRRGVTVMLRDLDARGEP
jgi:hypothetical protein